MPRSPSRRNVIRAAAAASVGMLLPQSVSVLAAQSPRFAIGEKDFLLDGKPLQIRCGEVHFPRVPREYWRHRLQAIKAMAARWSWRQSIRPPSPPATAPSPI